MFCREGGGATAVAGQRWAAARVVEREMRDEEDDKKEKKIWCVCVVWDGSNPQGRFCSLHSIFFFFFFLLFCNNNNKNNNNNYNNNNYNSNNSNNSITMVLSG